METNQSMQVCIQFLCSVAQSASGEMKNSISICSNSRERKMKLRGLISLRKALPIWAMPKGIFTRPVSTTFLKLMKMPCAVSGRSQEMAESSASAPTRGLEHHVEGARRRGEAARFAVAGEGTSACCSAVASV